MNELAAVGMQNLQAVVTCVSDALNADHVLNVLDSTTGNDGDVHVRHVRQPLKDVLGFLRQRCQVGMWSDGSQSSVVIEQKRELVVGADVAGNDSF